MGLWLLESCRKEWQACGRNVDYATLLAEVAAREAGQSLIYPDDGRLYNPESMTAAINEQLAERGETLGEEPAAIAQTIFDSLALRYASVIRAIEALTSRPIHGVQIVGGGSRNDYLNQATANATGKPVLAGPVEATVIGNVLVQAIAAGRFVNLSDARRHTAGNVRLKRFEPQASAAWAQAAARYDAIEAGCA
jgi:rhamnulokinase